MLSKTKEIKERFKEFDKTENLITEYGVITENGDEGNGEIKLSEILDLCDHIDELERKLKIAEDAIDQVYSIMKTETDNSLNAKNETDIILLFGDIFIISRTALKQIRGE